MLNYLQYESRRPDYLKAWWSVVDWEQAAACFDAETDSINALLILENKFFLAA